MLDATILCGIFFMTTDQKYNQYMLKTEQKLRYEVNQIKIVNKISI